MIKIDNITLTGYKNIHLDNLELGNFNVIVGPNNSGKSNFMQFFSFLDFLINGPTDEVAKFFAGPGPMGSPRFGLISKFIRNESPHSPIELSLIFSDDKEKYTYSIKIDYRTSEAKAMNFHKFIAHENFTYKKKSKTGPPNEIFNRDGNKVAIQFGFLSGKVINEVADHISVLRLFSILPSLNIDEHYLQAFNKLNSIIKSSIYYFSSVELSKDEETNKLYSYNDRIISLNYKDEIIALFGIKDKFNFFRKILKEILSIDEVFVIKVPEAGETSERGALPDKTDYLIYFKHFGRLKDLRNLSDGSRAIIAMVTKVLVSADPLILMEEPENSLHPMALLGLIKYLRMFEAERQFIITTHSIALINNVQPEDIVAILCNEHGLCEMKRVKNQKELYKRLKKSRLTFSDELFFHEEQLVHDFD